MHIIINEKEEKYLVMNLINLKCTSEKPGKDYLQENTKWDTSQYFITVRAFNNTIFGVLGCLCIPILKEQFNKLDNNQFKELLLKEIDLLLTCESYEKILQFLGNNADINYSDMYKSAYESFYEKEYTDKEILYDEIIENLKKSKEMLNTIPVNECVTKTTFFRYDIPKLETLLFKDKEII